MNFITKYYKQIIIVILIIILIIGIQTCNHYKTELNISNLKYNKDSLIFQTKFDKLGQSYIEQEQRISTYEEAIKSGIINEQTLKDKNLKDVQTIVNLKQEITGLKDTILKYKNQQIITIIDTNTKDTINYLRIPVEAKFKNKFVNISQTILKSGIRIDTLSLVNDMQLIIALNNKGLFRKDVPVITIQNSNPYFTPIKLDNIIIKEKTPWYKQNITWLVVGVAGGFILFK